MASPPVDNPKHEGYRFDGWSEHDRIMDFRTPITSDTVLKAKWTPVNDWALNPDHGPASGGTSITITPPSADSPSFSTLEAQDGKLIEVTGDGRLFTWTSNDKKPVRVPSLLDTSGEVRFTAGVAGDNSYAALSRDHRIYIWSKSAETPALLEADSTTYTSIAMAADRLMAVDQEGRIHTWTSKGEPTGKAISLPRQALAIKAAANIDRLLALDSKGQAWTWKPDAIDTNQIQPVKLANRIVQISAMDHGFMLLDSAGQASYLDNGQNQTESLVLPDHSAVTAISINTTQAALVDSKGHIWAWKLGEAPIRADDGSQQYVQAAEAGSRIIAINRQGDAFAWSLGQQGQPGKPARLDTATAPILESASLDSQPLKLTKNNGSWQTGLPARKPGPAAITITGRQDGQPFTRSLGYTVDQTLTRDDQQGSAYTVHFNTGGGGPTPQDQNIQPIYGRIQRPSPDPTRQGYQFDGWFTGNIAYDFSKPVTTDLTLTAHWTPNEQNSQWRIDPNKGSQLGRESTTITPPDSASRGIRFSQVSGGKDYSYGFSLAVGSDGNAYAWGYNGYGQLGDGTTFERHTPVMVKKPDRKTYPGLPEDFTYVQVSAGGYYSLALGSDGYVYAWGNNQYGQLGNNTKGGKYDRNPVPVRVRDPANPEDANKGLQATQVSAGYSHSLAVGSDGYVYAWGDNTSDQLGNGTRSGYSTAPVRVCDPSTHSNVNTGLKAIQISGGNSHSLAVGSDGYAYSWGSNGYGQLGNNTDYNSSVPVRVRDPANPTDASRGLKATQVGAGEIHSLAVGSDGYAYSWGGNGNNELGNNTGPESSSVPVHVFDPGSTTNTSKGLKATQVSCEGTFSLALGSDGYAYAWGWGNNGQLGNTESSSVPARVRDPAYPTDTSKGLKAVQISAGGTHSLAVSSYGYAYAWGENNYGRLGDGTTNSKRTPVPVSFNLQPAITGVRFGASPGTNLKSDDGNSVTVFTPAHQPGMVTVSVDYTLGGAPQKPDTSLRYTYLPAGVLPRAGGEGILLALAAGMTGMGGVLASRRHRQETRRLLHASHE